jgi:CHAT domain-containing protein
MMELSSFRSCLASLAAADQKLGDLLVNFDDDNFQTREAATQAIADLPAEACALVQAAFKRYGVSADARKRLGIAANAMHLKALRGTRQKQVGAAHPFFWAGFVVVGDPE